MKSYARADIQGHLGADATSSYLPNGTYKLSFSIAHSPYAKQGEEPRTAWYRASWFGSRAEKVQPYLVKGTAVHIRGDLDQRPYTDKAGVQQYSLEINVKELDLLGSRGDGQGQAPSKPASNQMTDEEVDLLPF